MKKIKLILLLFLIISSHFCCCLMSDSNDVNNKGMSAFEGKKIADPIALNWCENIVLFEIRGHYRNGYAEYWFYDYMNSSLNSSLNTEMITIKVFEDKSYYVSYFKQANERRPILVFKIDSPNASDIALSNEKIERYLSKYNADIEDFDLRNIDGTTYWKIFWDYDPGGENYKRAEIHIDANSGEVLYVKADD